MGLQPQLCRVWSSRWSETNVFYNTSGYRTGSWASFTSTFHLQYLEEIEMMNFRQKKLAAVCATRSLLLRATGLSLWAIWTADWTLLERETFWEKCWVKSVWILLSFRMRPRLWWEMETTLSVVDFCFKNFVKWLHSYIKISTCISDHKMMVTKCYFVRKNIYKSAFYLAEGWTPLRSESEGNKICSWKWTEQSGQVSIQARRLNLWKTLHTWV